MVLKIECEPCGETLMAVDEDELVTLTTTHALADHGVHLTRDDILGMAQPA